MESAVSRRSIFQPGETYAYEFTLVQSGVQMYHPHSDEMVQMAMGMQGFFVIHPKGGYPAPVDRHFCIFLAEWFVEPGTFTPNPSVMTDFNLFTFNSRVYPGTDPLVVKLGQRVRFSFANLSMDSHPIHFHGHRWWVVETDGGQIPKSAWWPETTVNVPPGTTRTVEFVADNPGDWAFHCHKNHHTMNVMDHQLPNMIGVNQKGAKMNKIIPGYMAMGSSGMGEMGEMNMGGPKNTLPMMSGTGPFGPIEMGGMFTILKVREGITNYEDPGWCSILKELLRARPARITPRRDTHPKGGKKKKPLKRTPPKKMKKNTYTPSSPKTPRAKWWAKPPRFPGTSNGPNPGSPFLP